MSKKGIRFWRGALFCFLFIFCLMIPLQVEAVSFEDAQLIGTRIAAGKYHSIFIEIDDTVTGWGDNRFGQLALPEGLDDPDLSHVEAVSAGYYHTLGLRADGTVVAWGAVDSADPEDEIVDYGQVGEMPPQLGDEEHDDFQEVIAVAAGGYHSLALLEDGTVVQWGRDYSDVLGDNYIPIPEKITDSEHDDFQEVIAIAAGEYLSVALLTDGTVVQWGRDYSNDATYNPMPNLENVKAIAAGSDHALALLADGTVESWGAYIDGQGDISASSEIVAISACGDCSVALFNSEEIVVGGNIAAISVGEQQAIAAGDGFVITVHRQTHADIKAYGVNDYYQCSNIPAKLNLIGGLQDFTIEGATMNRLYDPNVLEYTTVDVANEVTSVNLVALPKSTKQTLFSFGVKSLEVGPNHFWPRVRFADTPVERCFRVQITREALPNVLSTLKTNVGFFSPHYTAETTDYEVSVNKDVANIDVIAPANSEQVVLTFKVNGDDVSSINNIPLNYGKTVVEVNVAATGYPTNKYTVNIEKAGFLETLIASEGQFTTPFDPERFMYTLTVNSNITSLQLTPTLKDGCTSAGGGIAHEISYNNVACTNGSPVTINLSDQEFHIANIRVKEPDSKVERTYKININRVNKGDFVGAGISEDPYLIYNLHALQEIAYDEDLWDSHFQLACDFDASESAYWNNGAGFLPIGTPDNPFTGNFDGAGHIISNLHIDRPEMDYVGLFGYVHGIDVEIRDLGLKNCVIVGGNNVGALVGFNQRTYLDGCFSTGSVEGSTQVGGLVGYGVGLAGQRYFIENCYSLASVSGTNIVGGLVGELGGGGLKHCYAAGLVTAAELAGGLVAEASMHAISLNCYWDMDVSMQPVSAIASDVGSATEAMQEQTNYRNWDFVSSWEIINDDYPYLCSFNNVLLDPVVDNSLVLWLEGKHGSNGDPDHGKLPTRKWLDLSGKGNHGELQNFGNEDVWTDVWTGDSLKFTDGNDRVHCPSINIGGGDFTIEFFASRDICTERGSLFAKCASCHIASNMRGFGIGSRSGVGELRFYLTPGLKISGSWTSQTGYLLERVYPLTHIVVTRVQNEVYGYIDGDESFRFEIVHNYEDIFNVNEEIVRISDLNQSEIVSMRLYDRALNTDEITQNYQVEQERQESLLAANLASLTVSPGVLRSTIKNVYNVTVEDRHANVVQITATPSNEDANITIDGDKAFKIGSQFVANINISAGIANIPVIVTEGEITKTYYVRVVKRGYLDDLKINGSTLTGFDPETLTYTFDVKYGSNPIEISGILSDPNKQDLVIGGEKCNSQESVYSQLEVGQTKTIIIKVSGSGYETTYTLNVFCASRVYLKELETDLGILTPGFDPVVKAYTISLDTTSDWLRVTARAFEDDARITIVNTEISGNGEIVNQQVALESGHNEIKIKVANDSENTEYILNVDRPVALTDLVVRENSETGTALNLEFNKDTIDYYAEVDKGVTCIFVIASATSGVEISINNEKVTTGVAQQIPLISGRNLITIKATISETSRTYTLEIVRDPSNTTLESMKIIYNSEEKTLDYWGKAFSSEETSYTLNLDKAVDDVQIIAKPSDLGAIVSFAEPTKDNLILWYDGKQGKNDPPTENWLDLSGNGHHGELCGFEFDEDSGWTGEGLVFDGVNDYVKFTNPLEQGDDFTISFFVDLDEKRNQCFFCTRTESGEGLSIFALTNNTIRVDTTGEKWGTGYNIPIKIKTHVAVTKTNGNLTLYINGNYDSSISVVGDMSKMSTVATLGVSQVDGGGHYDNRLKGIMSFVRIYNRALSAEEVLQNYETSLEPAGQRTLAAPLKSGLNAKTIIVRGVDGVSTGKYTLNIKRPGGLENLEIKNSSIAPEFAKNINEYNVQSNVFLVEVTPELDDLATQELFISVNGLPEIVCDNLKAQILELGEGNNTVEVKVKTSESTNKYTFWIDVDPLVKSLKMEDLDGEKEVRNVFGAHVFSKLGFNLRQSVSRGLKIKFGLPESLEIHQVIGLYQGENLIVGPEDIEISRESIIEGDEIGNNVITINQHLFSGTYDVKFVLTNEPIKLKVGVSSFSELDGNELGCKTEPLEITYIDFPKML